MRIDGADRAAALLSHNLCHCMKFARLHQRLEVMMRDKCTCALILLYPKCEMRVLVIRSCYN